MALQEIENRAALAGRLADAARAAILPHFRSRALQTDNKSVGGYDPVTVADRAAEQAMRDILEREAPQDAILGEEFGACTGTSGCTWVLDPIDGTRGFVSGTPTWGVLIALSDEDGPRLGIIDQPYIGERFIGDETGARLETRSATTRLSVRTGIGLDEAILFTTFPEVGSEQEGAAFRAVSRKVRLTRYGLDCYAYALLAAGQIDLVIEADLKPYDVHAPIALVQAAGGIVTDWSGGKAHNGGQIIAAATPQLHAAALDVLAGSMAG